MARTKKDTTDLKKFTDVELRELAAQVCTETRQRFGLNPDAFTAMRGQDACKRAMLIAAIGGLNIVFVGKVGAGKQTVARAADALGVIAAAYTVVPGNPGHFLGIAGDTINLDVGFANVRVYDMCCEVYAPNLLTLAHATPGMTLDAAKTIIAKAQKHPVCPYLSKLGVLEKDMLNMATQNLQYTPEDAVTVVRIAAAIASMDEADSVKLQHLSEAITYRPPRPALIKSLQSPTTLTP